MLSSIKPDIKTQFQTTTDVKASKWRNIIFDKTGKSYMGMKIFNSKDSAKKYIEKSLTGNFDIFEMTNGRIPVSHFSWALQIPILGDK